MIAVPPYYLGVDGGGTHCRVRLRDAAGQLLGEAQGGLCNIYQDFDGALRALLESAQKAARDIGLGQIHAGLGLAGATGPEQRARVLAAGLPFASVTVESDGLAACLGAHGGGDGGIVIAGTGSAGLALVGGLPISVGGHGFVLGDPGSGAVMGRALLQQALLAHDGMIAATPLTSAVMAEFGDDPANLIEWSRMALSRDYAAFAPRLFAAAPHDKVADAILQEGAGALAAIASQLQAAGAVRLSLLGGIGAAILPWLPEIMRNVLHPPIADAMEGALLLARQNARSFTASPG